MIKCLIIDRDSVINHASKDPESPFYYIFKPEHLVLKPNVREAFALLNALRQETGLKVYLATKQRCVSKRLITRRQVDWLNEHLQTHLIPFVFDGVYVEESAPDKRALFATILSDSGLQPSECLVIDDSGTECDVAATMGFAVGSTDDLYMAVCHTFAIS